MIIAYDNISTTSSQSTQLFKKCCCCVPLRVGCFILGYLSLVINVYQTAALMFLVVFLGMSTHGFDHIDPEPVTSSYEDEAVTKYTLNSVFIFLMVVIILNVLWIILNIACLVGLHKRRPGPVRVFVSVASVRLVIGIARFIRDVSGQTDDLENIVRGIDLALAAYFLLVYYVYAKQLERENLESQLKAEPQVNEIAFIYPTSLSKEHLIA